MPPSDAKDPDSFQMGFTEHLDELRARLLKALYGVLATSAFTFIYGRDLIAWLCLPLSHAQRNAGLPTQTYNMTVLSGFTTYMKVSFIAAVVLAAPWILYQLWKFIAQGLYASEQKIIVVLAPFSSFMMLLGVAFAYYIILPLALTFLIYFSVTYPMADSGHANIIDRFGVWTSQFDLSQYIPGTSTSPITSDNPTPAIQPPPTDQPTFIQMLDHDPAAPVPGQWWLNTSTREIRILLHDQLRTLPLSTPTQNIPLIDLGDYISFVLYMILAMVIAFQLPVAMLILGWIGLVDPRWIAAYRRHCMLACFAAAAIITPTGDPFNMTLLAVPLWLLFEFGLVLMRLTYRRPTEE